MINVTLNVAPLHNEYCKLTDRDMPMNTHMMFSWEAWCAKGFVIEDLRLVVRYIKHLIKLDRRRPESFRFYNLIQNTDRFCEDLCEASAWQRQMNDRPDPARAAVLRATARPVTVDKPVQTPAQVMAEHATMARLLNEWKATL